MMSSIKDTKLVQRSRFAIAELEKALEKYHTLYDDISHFYSEYEGSQEPSPRVEMRLKASVLLFEHYFFSQPTTLLQDREYSPTETTDKLVLSLSGNWLTHELGQLLFSANTIFQLFAVRDIALRRLQYDDGLPRTRKDVYDNAKLFYYLRPDEELKVKQIHFSSPGMVELITQLSTLVPALKDAVVVISLASCLAAFVKALPGLYRHYVQEITKARQILRQDERMQVVHEFFKAKVQQEIPRNLSDTEIGQITEVMDILDSSIMKVTEEKVADPVRLAERIIKALSSLGRAFSDKKLAMGHSEDVETNKDKTG